MSSTDAGAPEGHSQGGRVRSKSCAIERAVLIALALAAPALGFAQDAGVGAPTARTPVTNAPGGSVPAAEVPGATLPGIAVPYGGLTAGGSTGLTPMPAEYTRYGASVGVGATDNVDLSPTHPKSQTLAAANLFFDLIRTGSRLELSALGNFSDTSYLEHAYSNQVLGRFDGLANLTLWQHHLKWLVRDDYGDSQINVLQSLTPQNLQRVNVFSTGPDLRLRPTLSSFVELQGIYSRNTWQSSPFSGQSEMGSATLGHRFSPAASISLVGQVQEERFDNSNVNTDYQIREYYGRYQLRGARTTVDLQGGLDQANDTTNGSWTSSPLVRLSLTRNISPFSTLSLSGGRDYIDMAGSFASLASSSGGIPINAAAQTTANSLQTYANGRWGFHRLRTTLNLFAGWDENSYDRDPTFNYSMVNVGLNLNRQLTPRFSANIMATVDRSRYANQGFTDNYGTLGGGLVYRPGKWLVLYGRYDHQFRRPSGVTRGLGYDENRIYVMIGYYPHSSGTGTPGEGGMGMGGIM